MRATTVAERPVWICASSCWSLAVLASMSRISISAARMPAWASAAPPLMAVQAACHLAGSMLPRWISWLAVVGISRPMVEMKSSCTCSEAMRSSAAAAAVLQIHDRGLQLALLLADGGVGVERLGLDRADDDVLATLAAHPHRFRKQAGRQVVDDEGGGAGRQADIDHARDLGAVGEDGDGLDRRRDRQVGGEQLAAGDQDGEQGQHTQTRRHGSFSGLVGRGGRRLRPVQPDCRRNVAEMPGVRKNAGWDG